MNEDLNKWFKEKWVNIGKKVDGKHPPCGTSGEKKGYAKCVPAAKAAGMSKKEKESATQRKRAAQNDAGRGGKNSSGQGKKPIYVSTKPKNETMNIEERLNLFLEKNCPTDAGKWSASKAAAKSKFDVYPSAYANGWAAKNYKGKGGGWKTCSESIVNEAKFKSPDYIISTTPASSLPQQKLGHADVMIGLKLAEKLKNYTLHVRHYKLIHADGKVALKLTPEGKTAVRVRTEDDPKYLQLIQKTVNDVVADYVSKIKESVNEACWDGYKQVGGKMKNGKMVPNCVPISEEVDTDYDELDVEPEEIEDFIEFLKAYKNTLAEANCNCVYEAEYQGREVKLGKPMQGDVKKFKVYVKNPAGNIIKVNFGQKGMKIRKSNPAARKSFRARMNCDNPGPRTKANYWSCRKW